MPKIKMSKTSLPLILVSAVDLINASELISEIIDNEVTDSDNKQCDGRVWRLINKYYSADVELCPVADGAPLPPPAALERVEAHLIYVTSGEGCGRAEARCAALGGAAARSVVRLLALAGGAGTGGALEAWALRRGYEPVPLAERAPSPPAPPEPRGVERLRAALHAHAWRGLRRLDRGQWTGADEEEGSDEEAAAVERAEAFAEALGALAGAGGGLGGPGGGLGGPGGGPGDAERRLRAESLVAAFCRALGADLPPL